MATTDSLMILENILRKNFTWLESRPIKQDDELREDLELDSLSMVNLQVALEDSLGIRFDPIEMDIFSIFSTVGSLAEFIDKYGSNPSR